MLLENRTVYALHLVVVLISFMNEGAPKRRLLASVNSRTQPAKPSEPPAYRERLPPNCPPPEASALANQIVLRLVPDANICPDHFTSSAGKGRPCPSGCTPCVWSACSVYPESTPRAVLADLCGFPKLRNMKMIAHLAVDELSGVAQQTGHKGHISLWMYANFDPVNAIKSLEPLP